jgi:hypothetical protein
MQRKKEVQHGKKIKEEKCKEDCKERKEEQQEENKLLPKLRERRKN